MAELSQAQRAVVTQLAERCPDAMLERLARMTTGMPGEKAQALAGLLRTSCRDRTRRAFALGPLLPLFAPRIDGVEGLSFPASVLPRLWSAASTREAALLDRLDRDDDEARVLVAERVCRAAAAVVRDDPDLVWPRTLSPAERDSGLVELAACLDLATLARKGVALLPALILRPTGDQIAEFRLLIKDSDALTPEGARRLLDILFAHLGEAFLILRVITQSSGAAGRESFLSECELAGFVERLLTGVEQRVARVAGLAPTGQITALVDDTAWASAALQELDITLRLQPESPWGRRAKAARGKVSEQLTTWMKQAEKAVDQALPLTRQQIAGRMTRNAPKLDLDPGGPELERADALLTLVSAIRPAAGVFGCESVRKALVDRVTDRLSSWAEEALELINGGEAPDEDRAIALVEKAADMLERLDAADLARSVRRRAAVAGSLITGGSPAAA